MWQQNHRITRKAFVVFIIFELLESVEIRSQSLKIPLNPSCTEYFFVVILHLLNSFLTAESGRWNITQASSLTKHPNYQTKKSQSIVHDVWILRNLFSVAWPSINSMRLQLFVRNYYSQHFMVCSLCCVMMTTMFFHSALAWGKSSKMWCKM